MKIVNHEVAKTDVKYIVEADESIWKSAQEQAFKTLSLNLKLPGFRVGHVPANIAKKQISESEILEKGLKKAIDETYKQLIEDKDFNAEEVIEDALTIDLKEVNSKKLIAIYIFEKYPDVILPDYKKIKIDYQEPKVDDKEIEREISNYTKKDNMLIPKDDSVIALGDMANFDFKGFLDDRPFPGGEAQGYELEIGSNMFIPGFEEQMIGAKKGEKKTIEVTFPTDYHANDLAGKKAKFEIIVNDVKTIQKPLLDEAYIARFNIPEVKNESDLRGYIKKQILDTKNHYARQSMLNKISTYLVEHTKLSYVPKSLLDVEIKNLNNDTNRKAIEAKVSFDDYITKHLGYKDKITYDVAIKENSEKNLNLILAIEKIVQELKLEVSQAELDDHLVKISKAYNITKETLLERFKNNLEPIKTFVLQEKAFDKLIELNK